MNTEPTGKSAKPTPEERAMLRDYEAALRTVRSARGVFLVLLVLSLLIHMGAFCAVRWGELLPTTKAADKEMTLPEGSVVTDSPESDEAADRNALVRRLLATILPLAEFVGQISCGLLAFCFLASGNICLGGGLGGVRGSLSAFFWTLALLALLFPWERWLSGIQIPGVYLVFEELDNLSTAFTGRFHEALFYVRFLGYPLLALLIALVGNSRYARGYRLVRRHLETRLQARPI